MLIAGDSNYQLMSLTLEIQNNLLEKNITDEDIFHEICTRLSTFDPYHIVWVGVIKPDGAISIEAVAGSTTSYLEEFNLRWDDAINSSKPEAHILRDNNENSNTETFGKAWIAFLAKTKTFSLLIQPLFIENYCFGALFINSKLKSSFNNDVECALLSMTARYLNINPRNHHTDTNYHALFSQLQLTATVFERMSEGVIIADIDGKIVNVNPALSAITGYSKKELIGKTPQLLQSGLHNKSFYTAMWQSILQTGSWSGEVWNKHKNGNIYLESLSITTVKDTQNDKQSYIAIINEISSDRETRNEL